MYKAFFLFIFIQIIVVDAFAQAPTFMFCDSSEASNYSPLNKYIAQKNGITKVLEYRQFIRENGNPDTAFLFHTFYYDTSGNLTHVEMHGKHSAIPNAITNYIYDSIGRPIEELQLYNIHTGDKFTIEVKYNYIGDSIIETTYYIPFVQKNIIDTSVNIKYFNDKKQLIKFIKVDSDSKISETRYYEYDEDGYIVAMNYTDNVSGRTVEYAYHYGAIKRGRKITMKQSAGNNNNGTTSCTYNSSAQCITCIKDWPILNGTIKYEFEYNDNGTICTSKCKRQRGTVILKYSYPK